MTNPIIKIVDTQTGEEIEREMNAEEFANYQKSSAESEANAAKLQAIRDAKLSAAAKLEALGLTVDDLAALGL